MRDWGVGLKTLEGLENGAFDGQGRGVVGEGERDVRGCEAGVEGKSRGMVHRSCPGKGQLD